ncbi:hypothetical protein GW17_00026543 [Ensete ventricosum]|nr:hypothetical protein GW17_00026543 [Ensete ventricosum]RZS20633.1 hypothetical protein BHM03_00053163 [Ensete ventricosum]
MDKCVGTLFSDSSLPSNQNLDRDGFAVSRVCRRRVVVMADPAAYFMRREIADQDAGAQLGSQVAAPPENRLNLAGPSSGIRSSGFPVEPLSGLSSSHGCGVSRGELVKRRRGRPRKYGPDAAGAAVLAFSPTSSTAPALMSGGSDVAPPKRRRGRPPGTGRKQKLASHGELKRYTFDNRETLFFSNERIDIMTSIK